MSVKFLMVLRLIACVSLFLLLAIPCELEAQIRAELVESGIEAYFSLETDRARDYFVRALDPSIESPDSIWAVGLQYLTQMHLEAGNTQRAEVWMRWAVRHYPDMQVDSLEFLPEVIEAYSDAVGIMGAGVPADSIVETTWEWPPLGNREANGTFRTGVAAASLPVNVRIAGRGSIPTGEDITLPLGTYSIQVSAQGYDELSLTREILPGVTTALTFNFEPIIVAPEVDLRPDELPDDVDAIIRSRLARFSAARFGTDPTCGTGFLAGHDGLLLTTYTAIRGAESLQIELADGSRISSDINVAAWNAEANVAVLKVPVDTADALDLGREVEDGQWTWTFTHVGCEEATLDRRQVMSWNDRPNGRIQFSEPIETGDQGGPVVSQSGAVIGLSEGALAAVPIDHVMSTIESARRNVEEDRLFALRTVAEREHHLYGSVMIQSTFSNATAHISPLENWHWPEMETSGPIPLTYSGPTGRYQLDLQAVGQEAHRTEFTIDPGAFKEITEPQIVAADGGGGGFPWPIALIGAAGAAVGGFFALKGGSPEPPPPGSGWIKIPLPSNP